MLDTAMRFANTAHMRFKAELQCPRPVELSAQVQPMILTPGHNSLPSGHATEAYMTAFILRELRGEALGSGLDTQLQRQAARIAINRTVAGVHYPIDSVAGRILGTCLAEYFLARCDSARQKTFNARAFEPSQYQATADFDWTAPLPNPMPSGNGLHAEPATYLAWLWNRAIGEW